MTLLVFGKTGQVARELARVAPEATFLDRAAADLTDPMACEAIVASCDATAIINAAAYTAVDRAEEDRETAMIVNAMAPTAMAAAAAARGIPFVHISTDYVFDGQGTAPFKPDDRPAPLGAYGASKLGGEEGIRRAGGTYAILRTAWVFSAHGNNFVKTMLRLGAERDSLSIVSDQIGGPTPARDIALACLKIAKELTEDAGKSGTYHFSGTPDESWSDFARAIFASAELEVDVQDISTADYPTPAVRPPNSRLDCSTTLTTFGIERPCWRTGLDSVLADLKAT